MSEGRTPRRDRLGRALATWPVRERTALEWEQSAERVVERIERESKPAIAGDVSDEDLLSAPLPLTQLEVQKSAARASERGEGEAIMSTETREKSRGSFADLAKLAQMTPPPSGPVSTAKREENSGVIDLAALQAKGEAQARAAASAPEGPVAAAPPTPSSQESAPAAGRTSRMPRTPHWLSFVGVAAAAAVAAGALVSLRQQAPTQATQVVVSTGAPVAQGPQAAAVKPVAPAPAAPPQADDPGVDLTKLPRANAAVPGQSSPPPVAANAPHAPRPVAQSAPAGAAPPNAAAQDSDKSLEALMQQAAGSPGATPVQPATAPGTSPDPGAGSVPLRPSLGAINGALGTAMPAARACVDADAPISHATVTFNSDGSVGTVSITGWAAGKPAEACIRAALSKARVPPFAQPTYTVPATIRSN
jgi:hypothetical protein